MDFEQQNEPELFRKQLAVAITSVGWSYAIFWCIPTTKRRVLKWGDGYYNGDIKTRKTVQEVEFDADEFGMQRSEQLRQLFQSLSVGGECSGSQARRPSAALSPEDLTDTEWYYMVCMSFKFKIGQGLPGRAFEKNQPIWLCNAHYADSNVFSRSLLAKSADIQTVVCFPFAGGVIELGITELVAEDLSLIQHIKSSFLETPPYHQNISNIPQWQFMDDVICNSEHDSMSSSGHEEPQTSLNLENISDFAQGEIGRDEVEFSSLGGIQANDIHYQNVLSTILKSSPRFLPKSPNTSGKDSSFVRWRSGGFVGTEKTPRVRTSQRMLKKVLFEVAQMHCYRSLDSRQENRRAKVDETESDHVLAERRRRKNINDKFMVLGSLVPATNKVDKLSILDNAIEYLKGLEKRVEELVSSEEGRAELQARTRRKKPTSNSKRKARDVDEDEPETVLVRVIENEAHIEIKCPWKESLLLHIMDTVTRLKLDSYSVQSINANGVLTMTIKSKFKGRKEASAATIKKALERAVHHQVEK